MSNQTSKRGILVVGSINSDWVVPLTRMPLGGETLEASPIQYYAGGKGANQAVAAARLAGKGQNVKFACQFGNDANGKILEQALKESKLDLSACGRSKVCPSGQGYVLLEADGSVSSIVVGGANVAWPPKLGATFARVRCWKPPPQDLVHVPKAPKLPAAQSLGQP